MTGLCLLACVLCTAQISAGQDTAGVPQHSGGAFGRSATYVFGAGDRVVIDVMDAEELVELAGKELQIGSDGFLNVPDIGRVHATGLTIDQLQAVLTESLKRYVLEPRIFVNVVAGRSQSVAVIGAVRTPGVQQLEGPKTLAQVLALAGGLSQDAGYQVKITRLREWGSIPLPNAAQDPSQQYTTADVLVRDLTDARSPGENIIVCPNDVITVPRSELIYVVGEVRKPGGFTLGEHATISVLQAVALAEGLTPTASANGARVLRMTAGSKVRTEMAIDLRKLSRGKAADVDLMANDILVIPNNATRKAGMRLAETALQTVSGLIIWRGL